MNSSDSLIKSGYPRLNAIFEILLKIWPEHEKFLLKSFSSRDIAQLADSELIADWITRIAGVDTSSYVQDYRWTCEHLLEEELNFRRTGQYRFRRLSELENFVYRDSTYMFRYLRGLLLSQLLWKNHFDTFSYLRHRFLPASPANYRHLEIGPGHGLLLHLASSDPRCSDAEGWDISPTSLHETKICLERLGDKKANLKLSDANQMRESESGEFDNIVMSEILEHVENPRALLESIGNRLKPVGGRVFINVPINSPAIDHIYLLKTPQEAVDLVESCGFTVTDKEFFPMTGLTLERAHKMQATISVVIVAKKS